MICPGIAYLVFVEDELEFVKPDQKIRFGDRVQVFKNPHFVVKPIKIWRNEPK